MGVRTSVGVMMSIVLLFVGVHAISESAQQNQASDGSDAEQAGQMAEQFFGNLIGAAGAEAIVWMGVAVIILVAGGVLVKAGAAGGGGR